MIRVDQEFVVVVSCDRREMFFFKFSKVKRGRGELDAIFRVHLHPSILIFSKSCSNTLQLSSRVLFVHARQILSAFLRNEHAANNNNLLFELINIIINEQHEARYPCLNHRCCICFCSSYLCR